MALIKNPLLRELLTNGNEIILPSQPMPVSITALIYNTTSKDVQLSIHAISNAITVTPDLVNQNPLAMALQNTVTACLAVDVTEPLPESCVPKMFAAHLVSNNSGLTNGDASWKLFINEVEIGTFNDNQPLELLLEGNTDLYYNYKDGYLFVNTSGEQLKVKLVPSSFAFEVPVLHLTSDPTYTNWTNNDGMFSDDYLEPETGLWFNVLDGSINLCLQPTPPDFELIPRVETNTTELNWNPKGDILAVSRNTDDPFSALRAFRFNDVDNRYSNIPLPNQPYGVYNGYNKNIGSEFSATGNVLFAYIGDRNGYAQNTPSIVGWSLGTNDYTDGTVYAFEGMAAGTVVSSIATTPDDKFALVTFQDMNAGFAGLGAFELKDGGYKLLGVYASDAVIHSNKLGVLTKSGPVRNVTIGNNGSTALVTYEDGDLDFIQYDKLTGLLIDSNQPYGKDSGQSTLRISGKPSWIDGSTVVLNASTTIVKMTLNHVDKAVVSEINFADVGVDIHGVTAYSVEGTPLTYAVCNLVDVDNLKLIKKTVDGDVNFDLPYHTPLPRTITAHPNDVDLLVIPADNNFGFQFLSLANGTSLEVLGEFSDRPMTIHREPLHLRMVNVGGQETGRLFVGIKRAKGNYTITVPGYNGGVPIIVTPADTIPSTGGYGFGMWFYEWTIPEEGADVYISGGAGADVIVAYSDVGQLEAVTTFGETNAKYYNFVGEGYYNSQQPYSNTLAGRSLKVLPSVLPKSVTSLLSFFAFMERIETDISGWDVSRVTNFNYAFCGAKFNPVIKLWNVSNATEMMGMFRFFNGDVETLAGWCVSKVTYKPTDFDDQSTITPTQLPNWGSCPSRTAYVKVSGEILGGKVITAGRLGYMVSLENSIYGTNTLEVISSNPEIVSVDMSNHCIRGVRVGTATITFIINNFYTATVDVEIELPDTPLILQTTGNSGGRFIDVIIRLPRTGSGFMVDWGDGKQTIDEYRVATHKYSGVSGPQTITVTPYVNKTYEELSFIGNVGKVVSWPTHGFKTIRLAAEDGSEMLTALTSIPSARPPNLKSMSAMFANLGPQFITTVDHWDFSDIVDLSGAFSSYTGIYQNLEHIRLHPQVKLDYMFAGYGHDIDLTEWCVTSTTEEPYRFATGSKIGKYNLPAWGTCPVPGSTNASTPYAHLGGNRQNSPTVTIYGSEEANSTNITKSTEITLAVRHSLAGGKFRSVLNVDGVITGALGPKANQASSWAGSELIPTQYISAHYNAWENNVTVTNNTTGWLELIISHTNAYRLDVALKKDQVGYDNAMVTNIGDFKTIRILLSPAEVLPATNLKAVVSLV